MQSSDPRDEKRRPGSNPEASVFVIIFELDWQTMPLGGQEFKLR